MKILYIGNSITLHGPKADIGWSGCWGMAASCEENDYVHVLKKMYEDDGETVEIIVRNVADLEREPEGYDLEKFADVRAAQPDIIVLRICENNPHDKVEAFGVTYDKLIGYFLAAEKKPQIAAVGAFWSFPRADALMKAAAEKYGVPFVSLEHLHSTDYQAIGLFEHAGVAGHPSDLGMRKIAEAIYEALH